MQLLVGKWMPGTTAIVDTATGKSETWVWDHGALSKSGEGGMLALLTNGFCIASWKNPEIKNILSLWLVHF